MNVSMILLRARVPGLPDDPAGVAERLTRGGFTVARTRELAELLKPVVVAKVEAVAQHPNADRLKLCTVNDGNEATVQVVTGADNVRAGAFYPFIRSGTTLPNGVKIKRGKLRGEPSEGMLGSADELELGTDHAGLLTLPDGLTPGTPLPDAYPVTGVVFELEGNPSVNEIVEALTKPG